MNKDSPIFSPKANVLLLLIVFFFEVIVKWCLYVAHTFSAKFAISAQKDFVYTNWMWAWRPWCGQVLKEIK